VKTVAVRLPEELVAQIEAESRDRRMSKSDVIRERLSSTLSPRRRGRLLDVIQEVTGLLDGLPADLSARKEALPKNQGLWPEAFSLTLTF
jgi:Arc/MetJ-type ribon-helix-helix transcriptional regulator